MRILHVIGSLAPRYGGPSVTSVEMCAALAERGHDVELFTTDSDGRGRLPVLPDVSRSAGGVQTRYFRVTPPRAYATSPALARALLRRTADFDVIHVHSLYLFHGLAACAIARRRNVPYIVRPHGTLDPYQRSIRSGRKALYTWLIERRNLELAYGVHCTSEEERCHVNEAFPRARTFVVPLGVSLPAPNDGVSRLPAFEGRRLVTFLGRLTVKKRPVLLVEGFSRVAQAHEDAHLVLAGPDDEQLGSVAVARANELGISDRVSVLGPLDRADAWRLLARSAAFVLPSADENFGVAAAEAMASGVPVVVTDRVALHGAVSRHEAGLVVESASAESLGVAIGRILANRDEAASMGANGRKLARSEFDWSTVAQRLEAVYAEAVG